MDWSHIEINDIDEATRDEGGDGYVRAINEGPGIWKTVMLLCTGVKLFGGGGRGIFGGSVVPPPHV